MFRDCLNGGLSLVLFSNSYIFVCYFMHHDKASIFTPVFKTALVQVSIGDKLCSPALDHFELIDFAFIEGVPGRTGIFTLWSNERLIGLFLDGGRRRKAFYLLRTDIIYMAFPF